MLKELLLSRSKASTEPLLAWRDMKLIGCLGEGAEEGGKTH